MTDQEQFEEIFTTYITRQGSAELLEWMKKTDFFTAPASTMPIRDCSLSFLIL